MLEATGFDSALAGAAYSAARRGGALLGLAVSPLAPRAVRRKMGDDNTRDRHSQQKTPSSAGHPSSNPLPGVYETLAVGL